MHRLVVLFRNSVTIFLALLSVSLASSFFIPAYRDAQRNLVSELRHRAELRSVAVDKMLMMYGEYVQALSSRTQIRKSLAELKEGQISLEEARTYTEPRYREGAAVYRDLLYAGRIDFKGRKVAELGVIPPGAGCTCDGDPSGSVQLRPKTGTGDMPVLEILSPIRDNELYLGVDWAVFDLSSALARTAEEPYYRIAAADGASGAGVIPETPDEFVTLSYPLSESGLVLQASYPRSWTRPEVGAILGPALLSTLIGLGALLLVAYVTLYRGSAELIKALEESIRSRENAMREANHRIKNNLNTIISLISLRAGETEEGPFKEAMDGLTASIRAIALIHEQLQTGHQADRVDLHSYLEDLIAALASSFAAERGITMIVSGDSARVGASSASALGFIVSELAMNAIKYALGAGDSFQVTIAVAGPDLILKVENGGARFPDSIDPLSVDTLGLTLVHEYALSLGGTLSFTRDPRTTFTFHFPGLGSPEGPDSRRPARAELPSSRLES